MNIQQTPLPGVLVMEPPRYADDRGWFAELWNAQRYRAAGVDTRFVQDNVSSSAGGVLRGMHYQHPHGQAKLITVLRGRVFDVAVDIRRGSPTFGRWYGHELSVDNRLQLYLPAGMAHGFLVLSDDALVHYNSSDVYDAAADRSLAWDDGDVAIEWPAAPTIISARDRDAPQLRDIAHDALPLFDGS